MIKKLIVLVCLTAFVSCTGIATLFTPAKKVGETETPTAKQANAYFWYNYHAGNYDNIAEIESRLNLALLENPNDLRITVHLGFVHVWALAERQRIRNVSPAITENILLSKRYFAEANAMNPNDPRVMGFLADMTLTEGHLLNNKRLLVKGYFEGKKAIGEWPQFNKFTLGYIFSILDTADKNFKQGLKWQYETIGDCACKTYPKNTDYKEAIERIKQSADPLIYRTCWNTWIAPHNWEGFFMNFGDMLVKSGQVTEAIKIYNLAKASDSYNEWSYKAELEKRIINAQANVAAFNKPLNNASLYGQNVMMFNSKMACTGCHQMSATELASMGYKEPGDEYYFLKK